MAGQTEGRKDGLTDRPTDRPTDRQTNKTSGWIQYTPIQPSVEWGAKALNYSGITIYKAMVTSHIADSYEWHCCKHKNCGLKFAYQNRTSFSPCRNKIPWCAKSSFLSKSSTRLNYLIIPRGSCWKPRLHAFNSCQQGFQAAATGILQWSHYRPKYPQYTPHTSPVRAKYMSFVVQSLKYFLYFSLSCVKYAKSNQIGFNYMRCMIH